MFTEQFLSTLADAVAQRVVAQLDTQGGAAKPKRLMTVAEAAEYLGRTEQAVRLLIHRSKIPVTKLDGKVQIDRAALDKLIGDCTFYES